MRSSWAAARQQAATLGSAESSWLPTISVSGDAERTYGPHQQSDGTLTSLDQTTKDAAVSLTWTLYDFGARGAHIRSARRLLDAAAFTVKSTSQQTILSVVQGYYGVVAADSSLAAAAATESIAQHSLEIARALKGGGVASTADVLQAETAYDQAVLARVQAQETAKTSLGTLAVLIGANADQPLKLAADPVPGNVPALTGRMEELMAEAAKQRPDLAAARSRRDAAIEDVSVARAAGWPTIAISAGRNTVKQTAVETQNFGQVGIRVTVPIFTGFSVTYGVRQAQAALESDEANAEQVRLNVTLDVWTAYHTLSSAIEQLATTATLLTAAQSNEDIALGRYQSGLGSIIDLLTAQTAAGNARQLRINAELAWEVSRAKLAFALGRLASAEPLGSEALP